MDLKAIQYIQEIVRCGSMAKAADNLYLSQSALSQYVNRLEKTLNVPLFERKGNRLHLTAEGTIFLREGGNILEAYENMCHHLLQYRTEQSDIARIGLSEFYGQFILPKLFPVMKTEYPQVKIQLVQESSNVLQKLVKEHVLDLCITPFIERQDGLSFEFICQEEIMVAVPSDCPALSQAVYNGDFPSLDIRALKDYPFIMMQKGQAFTEMGYEICSSSGFAPQVVCELTGWNSIYSLVAAKVGVSFLPKELAVRSNNADTVFCHIIAPVVPTRSITICTAKDHELPASSQNVIHVIKSIAADPDFFKAQ